MFLVFLFRISPDLSSEVKVLKQRITLLRRARCGGQWRDPRSFLKLKRLRGHKSIKLLKKMEVGKIRS